MNGVLRGARNERNWKQMNTTEVRMRGEWVAIETITLDMLTRELEDIMEEWLIMVTKRLRLMCVWTELSDAYEEVIDELEARVEEGQDGMLFNGMH